MNSMFSWQEQYLTRSLYSLVRYYSCHVNIELISSCHLVISFISSVSALSILIIVTLWLNFWLRNGKSYQISLNTKQLWYNNIVPINYMSILVIYHWILTWNLWFLSIKLSFTPHWRNCKVWRVTLSSENGNTGAMWGSHMRFPPWWGYGYVLELCKCK